MKFLTVKAMIMLLKPKNWAVFQHYKDRSPPWIKLHRDILNDRKYMCLPVASKALAPMLWLLASESKDGSFDASVEELHFRLRMEEKDIKQGIKALIDSGFFIIVSEVLAECYQVAIPETEGETETEIKKETEKKVRATALCPPDVTVGVWEDWKQLRKSKRATVSETVIEQARKEASKAGMSLNAFLREWCLRGSQGLKAEWIKDKQQPGQQLTAYQQSIKSAGISIFGNLEEQYAERNITPVTGRLDSKDI